MPTPPVDQYLEELTVLNTVSTGTIIYAASDPSNESYQLSVSILFTSPKFQGNPTAPTQPGTDNSTRLATTAFVKSQITGLQPLNSFLTQVSNLGDPGVDQLIFWDDSAGKITYLSLASSLSITGTVLSVNSANVTGVVHTTGNETITGVKTFGSPIVGTITGNISTSQVTNFDMVLAGKQPLDGTLSALAALNITANTLIYGTGIDTFALSTLTPFMRTLLDDPDQATALATLGVTGSGGTPGGTSGQVQWNNAGAFSGFGSWNGTTLTVSAFAGSGAGLTGVALLTGSYSDPSWITSLSGAKVTGNIPGNAISITGNITESQVINLVSDLSNKQPTGSYITNLTGDVTASGPGSVAATLANSGVTPGTYTNTNLTVDIKGRITAASTGSGGTGGSGIPGGSFNSIQYNAAGGFGGFGDWSASTLTIPGTVHVQHGSSASGLVVEATGTVGSFPNFSSGLANSLVITVIVSTDGYYGSDFVLSTGRGCRLTQSDIFGTADVCIQFISNTDQTTGYGVVEAVYHAGLAFSTYPARPILFAPSRVVKAQIDGAGNFVLGSGTISTSATDGFLYLPTCAGTPTGTPTGYTGRTPLVVDTTGGVVWIYYSSAWHSIGGRTPPGGTSGDLQWNNAGAFAGGGPTTDGTNFVVRGLSSINATSGMPELRLNQDSSVGWRFSGDGAGIFYAQYTLNGWVSGLNIFTVDSTGVFQLYSGLKFFALTDFQAKVNTIYFGSDHLDIHSAPRLCRKDGSGNVTVVENVGGGTVTSVGMAVPSFLSVSGSPITNNGTFVVQLATETAGSVFAGPPSGPSATPTFRGLLASDIPAIPESGVTNLTSDLALKAPLANPALTGTPTAPTATAITNNTQIATTAYVKSQNYIAANQTINLTGDVTGSGTTSISTVLGNSGVTASSYTNANITVNAKGLITAASNGTGGTGGGTPGGVNHDIQWNNSGAFAGGGPTWNSPALTSPGKFVAQAFGDHGFQHGSFGMQGINTNQCLLADNAYYDGSTFRYKGAGYGQYIFFGSNSIAFNFAPTTGSGTNVALGSIVTGLVVSPTGLSVGDGTGSNQTIVLNSLGTSYIGVIAGSGGINTRLQSIGSSGSVGTVTNTPFNIMINNAPVLTFTNTGGGAIFTTNVNSRTPLVIQQVSSGSINHDVGYVKGGYTNNVDASYTGYVALAAQDFNGITGGREGIRVTSNGSVAQVGFFGLAPVSQQSGDVATGLVNLGLFSSATTSGGTGGAVSSVFTRTGAVVAVSGDYTVAQVTGAAPLASPAFTGNPTALTQSGTDNSTRLATTAFVANAISALGGGSGTVTSVALTVPSFLSVTGSPITTSGTFAVSLANASVNAVFAGPGSGVTSLPPTFRALVAGDIPVIPQSQVNNLTANLLAKANLASPNLTGTPTAPTATLGDSSMQIATTAFVAANQTMTIGSPVTSAPADTVLYSDSSSNLAASTGLTFHPAGTLYTYSRLDCGNFVTTGGAIADTGGSYYIMNGIVSLSASGSFQWAPGSVSSSSDLALRRSLPGILSVTGNTTTTPGGVSSPTLQLFLSSSQNDWNPGPATTICVGSSGAVNITGMQAGASGQIVYLINVSAFVITLTYQDSSSLAANRFINHTGAAVPIAVNNAALLIYDDATSRWRVFVFA